MILVVDASAAVDLLVRSDAGERVRRFLTDTDDVTLMTVAHLDAEVLSALSRLHRGDVLASAEVTDLFDRLTVMTMRRLAITRSLLRAAWSVRDDNISARDALYVAAARAVEGQLLTTDERLARAVSDLAVPLT